jgi:hypothetical protein
MTFGKAGRKYTSQPYPIGMSALFCPIAKGVQSLLCGFKESKACFVIEGVQSLLCRVEYKRLDKASLADLFTQAGFPNFW